MTFADDDEPVDAPSCPYCASLDRCEHLLLVVDRTFRTAEGGVLMEAFNDLWSRIFNRSEPDFDEGAAFNELLEEVDALADAAPEYDFEGGPGMSSSYTAYYCASKGRLDKALATFRATSEDQKGFDGDHCPFCHTFNEPDAGSTCEHHVGCKWDGSLDLCNDLDEFRSTWKEVCELVEKHGEHPGFKSLIVELVGTDPRRQKLLDLARHETDFSSVMDFLEVGRGESWRSSETLGDSGCNLYLADRHPLLGAIDWYRGLADNAEIVLATGARAKESAPDIVVTPQDAATLPRPVLVIVTEWPGGTMAMKFGYAMRSALGVSKEEMQLVQMEPERIFRAVTDVSEEKFRKAMAKCDVSCHGRVLFVEL